MITTTVEFLKFAKAICRHTNLRLEDISCMFDMECSFESERLNKPISEIEDRVFKRVKEWVYEDYTQDNLTIGHLISNRISYLFFTRCEISIDEICPECGELVEIFNREPTNCPNCKSSVLPCGLCDMDNTKCKNCPWD